MATGGAAQKTVLIADDTPSVRDRFASALEQAGHRALTVRSAAELLARVRADLTEIDLIVMDFQLPHADGVDLVRALRRLDGGRLPILVFSGTVRSARHIRDLAELGIAGYVNDHSTESQIMPSLAPHLFPDNFNRRGTPRVVLGIPVAYRYSNTIAAGVTVNLGKGGVAIRTMAPLETAVRARVRFRLPNSRRDVDADARVAWSDRRVGMGLEFERVEPADQAAIDDFVDGQGGED
jgi:two-component system, chemotaxis family, chemotaxis protein CheY